MFLGRKPSLPMGSADSRNRKSAPNNTATQDASSPLPAVVVCCQEPTHNRPGQRERVFVGSC